MLHCKWTDLAQEISLYYWVSKMCYCKYYNMGQLQYLLVIMLNFQIVYSVQLSIKMPNVTTTKNIVALKTSYDLGEKIEIRVII